MRGKMQHVTFDIGLVDEDFLADGTMFDGSSIAGWKAINESDMKLRPDLSPRRSIRSSRDHDVPDLRRAEPDHRRALQPRPARHRQEGGGHLKSSGVGDTVFFGPEAEFFIFDDVRYQTTPYNTGFKLDSIELPINSDTEYEGGNLGHRSAPRAATSRSRRRTRRRTCARRCWR